MNPPTLWALTESHGSPWTCRLSVPRLEPAAELLRRVGAVRADDVIRYLVETCEALAALALTATVNFGGGYTFISDIRMAQP